MRWAAGYSNCNTTVTSASAVPPQPRASPTWIVHLHGCLVSLCILLVVCHVSCTMWHQANVCRHRISSRCDILNVTSTRLHGRARRHGRGDDATRTALVLVSQSLDDRLRLRLPITHGLGHRLRHIRHVSTVCCKTQLQLTASAL